MKIKLNGENKEVEEGCTVAGLVEIAGLRDPFSVALNGAFVSKSDYAETRLSPNDEGEGVKPVFGG